MIRPLIPAKVKKELFVKSGNVCAFPDCNQSLVIDDIFIGQLCHIVPLSESESRDKLKKDNEGLAIVDNMIVLCPSHHRLIDSKPFAYTAEWLYNTKKAHEKKVSRALFNSTLAVVNASKISAGSFQEALEIWEHNQTNGTEEFWQQFFQNNPKIIAQAVPKHIVKIGEKCYLGGKSITNKGGNLIDFLYASPSSNNVALVEIKTPTMKLVGSQYRTNAYSMTEELSGAIVQVLNYKDELLKNFYSLSGSGDIDFSAFNPRCLVIAGSLKEEKLNKTQQKSFDLYQSNSNVEIITYDELFEKVKDLIDIATP